MSSPHLKAIIFNLLWFLFDAKKAICRLSGQKMGKILILYFRFFFSSK